MAIQAEGFVLRKGKDTPEPRIDAIGESDVDDAVKRAEGNGGFGTISGERPETFALATGKENSKGIAHIRHECRLPRQDSEAV